MNTKHIAVGARPRGEPKVESWLRQGEAKPTNAVPRSETFTARITIDVTPRLRGRVKVAAFQRDLTVAELLRLVLERTFPEAEEDL